MADAAVIVESRGADVIDINFGCSVKKVVKTGAGVALMKEKRRAEDVLKAVRKAVKIPLTIKIRTGWEKSGEDALAIVEIAEGCGVDAIAVHPRTAGQGFRGKADWSLISRVKGRVCVPVIGNGDIVEAEDAVEMLNQTGCDAVMIGRAAIGNPWIFSQVNALISGKHLPPVGIAQRFCAMKEYLQENVKYFGEKQACYMMRSRLGWFVKGLPSSAGFRESIKHIMSENQAKEMIDSYFDFVRNKTDHALIYA
jgi:nifR3 family TIM-barrel protein